MEKDYKVIRFRSAFGTERKLIGIKIIYAEGNDNGNEDAQ